MYLKRLDILGFKSFANKTALHFSTGITAIVGPNGCGKTNILDAMRWVLGEQRVSLLRGNKMEEVIFNGTRDVKSLGMSEVTLSLINNRGVLPTEYNEVQVTRRLFRSGESEYLLNKVPCRLRDIHDLFYGTGMGAHSYSVIQQDMIDAVISDKAEERRFLFEEAAGITKYKQRKKAALRKLEATEGDMLRLNDIYSEVQTQVRSLNRQQKKAQRYQNLLNEIKDWELYLSSARLANAQTEKQQLRDELGTLTDRRMEREALVNRVSSQLENDRKEQIDLEQDLSSISNEVFDVSEKAHGLEREISILVEKRANARSLIERNQNDIQALKARTEILTEQTQQSHQDLIGQKTEHENLAERLTEAESAQAVSDRELLQARAVKEDDNKKLIDLEGKLSSGKTADDNLRRQEQEIGEVVADLQQQVSQQQTHRSQLQARLVEEQQVLTDLKADKNATEESEAAVSERIERLIEKGEELSLELSDLGASLEACQARRNLLEDMILHYEGYATGVVEVMEIKDRFSGIHGTVAEKFVPAEGLEAAMEAALGEMAGFIVCDNRPHAEQIIEYLKTEGKGKVGILVPDTGTINPLVKRPEIEAESFLGWLDRSVTTDDELRPLMQAVLSRTAVFEAGADPKEILERLPYGFSAVSTDGVRYSRNIIAGGAEEKFPLFRREEKLAEQDRMIAAITEKQEVAQKTKDRNNAEIGAARAESTQLADKLDSLSEELNKAGQKTSETEYRLGTIEDELARLEKERRNQSDKLEKIRSQQYTLGIDFNQLADQKQTLVGSMSKAGNDLESLEAKVAVLLNQVSKLQVEMVESRSRTEQVESKISHLAELKLEIENTTGAKQNEIERAGLDISNADERVSELEQTLKTVFHSRTEATERQNRLRGIQADIMARVTQREEQLKEVRTDKDSLSEQIHQIEMRINTFDSEIGAIGQRIRDEYELDIETVEIVRPDDKRTDEEARAYLADRKERFKNFGAVNLLALEEYRKACERESFLSEQLNDLTTAKDDLKTTISKINQTAKQLFLETFEKARGNFKRLFVDLFTGGEADIYLEDPSEPLESDIMIIARPRGKKLLSITMMSGGERALTAIALLFSLYQVKPSPFCILDEIDAPLDDANCRRFLNIIHKFSLQTQFVIITHNKITMEAAENLYGVTMEQPGISQLVAVKFNDVAEDAQTGRLVINVAESSGEPGTHLPEASPTHEVDTVLPDNVTERMNPDLSMADDKKTDD